VEQTRPGNKTLRRESAGWPHTLLSVMERLVITGLHYVLIVNVVLLGFICFVFVKFGL